MPGVPGRFEAVDEGQPFAVIVDYAHTPDSLDIVLQAARDLGEGRLICVFGAGGDRDRGKRPLMGAVAAHRADHVIVTSDNPRGEDPLAIIQDVFQGAGMDVEIDPDRRSAIHGAVAGARAGDVVVIAGKGHEQGQETAGVVVPFDDRVAREALREALRVALAGRRRRTACRACLWTGCCEPGRGWRGGRRRDPARMGRGRRARLGGSNRRRGQAPGPITGDRGRLARGRRRRPLRRAQHRRRLRRRARRRGARPRSSPTTSRRRSPRSRAWSARRATRASSPSSARREDLDEGHPRCPLQRRRATIWADASLNNEIGLPLTVCRLEPETEVLVAEMGMRGLGQIAALCDVARPHLVLVTSIGPEHLELVGTVERVAEANAEAIAALPPGGSPSCRPTRPSSSRISSHATSRSAASTAPRSTEQGNEWRFPLGGR